MAKIPTAFQKANSRFSGNGNGKHASTAPLQTVNRAYSYGYNNTLIEAASQTTDRGDVNLVDYDFHRIVSAVGRRTLISLARTMYWRVPALQAAIREQASLAVNPFTPIFGGSNKKWGEQAREWLDSFHSVMDLMGWPYDFESYGENLLIMSIVDGDIFTVLTEDASGNPRIQMIPSHKIGSRYQTGLVAEVRYEGNQFFVDDIPVDDNLPFTFSQPVEWMAPIIEGSILDNQGRALAYRVYEDPIVSSKWVDVSARNMFPAFLPEFPGQVRGYSVLSSSVFDWQDVREWRRFEMLAQKTFSSKTISETNETGDGDPSKEIVAAAAAFDTDNNKTTPNVVKLDGGAYHYFKAGSNSKLEAFNWGNRPGRESQDFLDSTIRDAFRGTEWDSFFSLDPQHVGGAPMRVVVDRVNRTIRKRRRLAAKNVLRVDVWALAKAIKNGDLPFDPEFYKWAYRGQPDVTADRRYDAQTDETEWLYGWKSMRDIEAGRGGDWVNTREQREVEADDKMTRAEALMKKHPDCSFQEAMAELGRIGNVNLSMNRSDIGNDALQADSSDSGGDQQQPTPKSKNQQNAAAQEDKEYEEFKHRPMTFNVNVDARPTASGKRKVRHHRDSTGKITTSEIEDL